MDMTDAAWRKSSYSASNGGECVEVGGHHGRVLVRDTKDQEGPVLRVSLAAWRRFAHHIKSGPSLAEVARVIKSRYVMYMNLKVSQACEDVTL
jgi:Domain of unknown function (DUF397)